MALSQVVEIANDRFDIMLADKLIGSNQFRMQMGGFQARQQPFEPGPGDDRPGQSPRAGGNTIEGEFERKE